MPKPIDQTAQPFLTRIEKLHADLESERGSYMATCRTLRDDIKSIYGEAKNAGVPVRSLKGLVRWRKLERDQASIAADMDDSDESAAYARLVETLGPLGIAAATAAGFGSDDSGGGDDDQRDMRPRFAQNDPRADEEHLARVGRGRAN